MNKIYIEQYIVILWKLNWKKTDGKLANPIKWITDKFTTSSPMYLFYILPFINPAQWFAWLSALVWCSQRMKGIATSDDWPLHVISQYTVYGIIFTKPNGS